MDIYFSSWSTIKFSKSQRFIQFLRSELIVRPDFPFKIIRPGGKGAIGYYIVEINFRDK